MKKTSEQIPFFRASITSKEEKAVLRVLRSHWLTTGNETLLFEKEFSEFMNSTDQSTAKARKRLGLSASPVQSLAVNSNTSGMILAMDALGVRSGKSVLTTPYTFVSTAACAKHLGAGVVFADTEKGSYSIDVNQVDRILSRDKQKKICAIVAVHIAGLPCDIEGLSRIAQKHGVKLIEDAAHSFPSPTPLGYAGTIGDAGVFSFYATKTITTGEGGMVCTRDKAVARRIATMRLHGMDRSAWDRYTSPRASWEYDIVEAGYKCNLPDILSALGREQLKRAQLFFERRRRIAEMYNEAFASMDFVELPPDGEGNAWHLYLCRLVPQKLKITRNEFASRLQKSGVGVSVHFIPLFYFSYWKNLDPNFRAENFPNAADIFSKTISLPLWPDMTKAMARKVISAVKKIGEEAHV